MKISVTIKIKPDYTCTTCGRVKEGTDIYNLKLLADTLEAYENKITSLTETINNPPRAGIPVGWKSHGTDGITCSVC